MKAKQVKTAFTALTLALGVVIGVTVSDSFKVGTSAVTPGSESDPVVTKSYVDEQIRKITGQTGQAGNSSNSGGTGSTTGDAVVLEVVTVEKGKTLMLVPGSEAVIRVGSGNAFSIDTNGLADLTAGINIEPGKPIPTNHLIWFPREGRGIKAQTELTVLVTGPYYIN